MVDRQGSGDQMIIRKETLILKNTKSIDEIYERDSKVSISLRIYLPYKEQTITFVCFVYNAFSNLEKELTEKFQLQLIERMGRKGP